MWNNINNRIKDRGLDAARSYLVNKSGVTQQNSTFFNHEKLKGLEEQQREPYQLYILAHGASTAASILSGTDVFPARQEEWSARDLALKLIRLGLPANAVGRIKLCMCFSGRDHGGVPDVGALKGLSGVFARNLAVALRANGQGVYHNVYVGGFTVEVNWDKEEGAAWNSGVHIRLPDEKVVYASRVYYDTAGTMVTNPQNKSGLRPFGNAGKAAVHGGSKWVDGTKPDTKQGTRAAYFPFNYEPF